MALRPVVFETTAYTIPPPRHLIISLCAYTPFSQKLKRISTFVLLRSTTFRYIKSKTDKFSAFFLGTSYYILLCITIQSMAENYLLSDYVKPSKYVLSLKPDLEKFTFYGEEVIHISLEQKTDEIILHAVDLEIVTVEISSKEHKKLAGTVTYDQKSETATLIFPEEIPAGQKELFLTFTGELNDKMRGFYRSKYEINGKEHYMATTQFEATDARKAFPCIDEPSKKAIFELTLIIPNDTKAISNTVIIAEEIVEENYKKISFAPSPKMSSYLLAFIVGKFEHIEQKTKEGILVRVFTTPGKKQQAQFALETAAKTISFYNEYFAIDYPLPTLDLIAIPDFAAGAMENWGAVTFRETTLLIDEKNSSTANKQWVALVIAHELAHMWFGDLVTMEWWTHLWLNEGFACFIEYVAVNALFPEWDIWTQFAATEHNPALRLDGLKNTHPIEVPVKHPSEISEIFDEVSYAKGASVIQMLSTFLGPKDFRDGLRFYLKKHAYANAKTEDLWEAFAHVSKIPIRAFMENWTQKPGYPVVSLEEKNKKLVFSQKRFFSSSISAKETQDDTVWSIPITISTAKNPKPVQILLESQEDAVSLAKDSWIKVNTDESSFFRTKYPREYLEALKKPIQEKQLSSVDRLGIIRDAFDLAEAGIGDIVDALSLVAAYKNETDYSVWIEIATHMHRLSSLLYGQKAHDAYTQFAKEVFVPIAEKMGWDKKPNESHTDSLLRGIVLYAAGKYGDKKTIKKAQELFADFITKKTAIDPDLRSVVYALVAENGGEKEFKLLTDLYVKEELHQEKDRIMRGLTAFKNPEIIHKTLAWSISENVRAQDAPRVLFSCFVNEYGRDATWEFLLKHWDYYQGKFAGMHGFSRVLGGAATFTSMEKAEQIETFFAKNPVAALNRTVKQVVEQITSNSFWVSKESQTIFNFLKK